ncbi:RND transporter family protein [Hydrogenimonas cancrithermarum]|uniref:Uncharacterized protein n=1 Tax=Hydrogenimonas cancrithermarum TaxID=2993563 RepID=A0ABN6WWW3_9BACT|nr:hypothetical protein [Hydrogenimonas cancrithermarum]BDY13715.1 hypothetical protein HCR_20270 [Hydrogenimonas cancrithermarum]
MRLSGKVALLILVWAMLFSLVGRLNFVQIDWESFFPQRSHAAIEKSWFAPTVQYLFVELPNAEVLEALKSRGVVRSFYPVVTGHTTLFLILFERRLQQEVLRSVRDFPHAGTVMASTMLLENFYGALRSYLGIVVPLLLAFSFLVFPLRYWISVLLELSIYLLFNMGVLFLFRIPVSPISMLAWLFLFIYALTLLNYMHLGEMNRGKLALGIGVSIVTTLISAIYLNFSDFGLIHEFGESLTLGLLLLGLFLVVRMFGIRHTQFVSVWVERVRKKLEGFRVHRLLSLFYIGVLGLLPFFGNALTIDLNPFNIFGNDSRVREGIASFEKEHVPALPFVVSLRFDNVDADFYRFEDAKRLSKAIGEIEKNISAVPLVTLHTLYESFAGQPFSKATDASYAQFLLALEMLEEPLPIFTTDGKTAYLTYSLSLTTPSEKIRALVGKIRELNASFPNVTLRVMGKVADFEFMSKRFLNEAAVGFGMSFIFILAFFLFYCKTWRIVPAIVVSACFPLVMFIAFHMAFGMPFTLISMIALILYAGLYADSFIHIFICYAQEKGRCLSAVLRPIVISNLTMIAALAGMVFSGSILGGFGIEMTLLLFSNLIGVFVLLPALLIRWVRNCNV